jgi:hypothetical protein
MSTIQGTTDIDKTDYVLAVNIPVDFVIDACVMSEESRPHWPEHLRNNGNLTPIGLANFRVRLTNNDKHPAGILIFMHPQTYQRLAAFGYNLTGYESSKAAERYKDGDTTFHLFEWVDEGTVVGMYQTRVGVIVNCVDEQAVEAA